MLYLYEFCLLTATVKKKYFKKPEQSQTKPEKIDKHTHP